MSPLFRWRSVTMVAIVLVATLGLGLLPHHAARAASTLTVTTTADKAPPCGVAVFSLRCAINQANQDGSGDTITFAIPSNAAGCSGTPAVCTIRLTSALPALTASHTTLNGYTQAGARPNTNVLSAGDTAIITLRLDGTAVGTGVNGLTVQGSNDAISGLSITNFVVNSTGNGGAGIALSGFSITGDTIAGNFLGVLPDGRTAGPNSFGVNLSGAPATTTIGGTPPSAANVISGNIAAGIESFEPNGNFIEGNWIGTNAAGTAALGNDTGIDLNTNRGTTVGGTASGAGNVISGNRTIGIHLLRSSGAVIQGNLIGTTAAETAALSNGTSSIGAGILMTRSNTILIGGTTNGAGNVISGNGTGLAVNNYSTATVEGNWIGTTPLGTVLPNTGDGVSLTLANGSSIVKNVLANNGVSGVAESLGSQTLISQNAIFANGGLGIDLAPLGTVSCAPGSNNNTPCPVITKAFTTKVSGTACANCTVEVFIATNEADDQGHGEGKTFLGSVTADGSGNWSLALASGQVSAGQLVTATATTPAMPVAPPGTSEFAANVEVIP